MPPYGQNPRPRDRNGEYDRYPVYDDNSPGYPPPTARPGDGAGYFSRGPQAQASVRPDQFPQAQAGGPYPEPFGYPPPPLDPRYMPTQAQPSQQRTQDSQHPSILIDPDETASQRERRKSSRSRSNVRLQVGSSDDSDYDHGTRGGPPRRPAFGRRRSLDLEQKTSDENRRFRSKRDDYESDEGEMLKRNHQPRSDRRPRRGEYDNNGYDNGYPLGRSKSFSDRVKDRLSLPLRGKQREQDESGFEYGTTPIAAGAGAVSGRPRLRGYDTDPETPRRRTTDADYDRSGGSRRYDSYHGDNRMPPNRRRNSTYDDRGYRSGERDRHRHGDGYDDYDNKDRRGGDGYFSAGERDRDRLQPRARRGDDPYYSDSRDDRGYRRERDRRDRDRGRGDRYDREGYGRSRDDDYYDRGDRSRGKRDSSNNWQKEAGAAFMTYAMPYIKKEGTKLVKRELQKFLEKCGGSR